ncbi:MAG: hypothetical protein IIY31_05670 [Desulfovibrio sp.]|jgi:hypothetical protein|nr:hypothetical protein [Desulfovibrio sp.]MBQ1420216.1 hypothetical protein [Desulfovibrio sp.]MBQ1539188.1 hypothetical protein [Desulfovibrio sp.]MBQ1846027.1 hypothetical protein [Desulfovibrio sp.]MBQ2477566.1 hypothetical protein [Desulfovibrio sp.]
MSTSSITVRGYVEALPRKKDERQARVAIVQDEVEYRVLTRGAGVDLVDEVSAQVEASGTVEEQDGIKYMTVRSYRLLDEEGGWDDDKA